jgi:predicted small secreted protein
MKTFIAMIVGASFLFLGGCNTMEGAGKDVKAPTVNNGSSMFDGMKQTEDCDFLFPAGANPIKLVMTGTKLVTVAIPFKLEHVKMP